ncbi:MAG: glycosyltransferase family 4 protein [Lentisphaerae bacterium]|nr:glycosyltransferase family 4 protein [Lentisphaerota bacterium]MCP4100569.1 glycosyltransferase family 4 protein [Lentisphaerota bacterium]
MVVTSIKDLTSTVLLEAISCGLPVICLKNCGLSHVIDDSCGIKILAKTPKQIENDIAANIHKLYNNEDLHHKMATGALKRAEEFSWDKKIVELNSIYTESIIKYYETRYPI